MNISKTPYRIAAVVAVVAGITAVSLSGVAVSSEPMDRVAVKPLPALTQPSFADIFEQVSPAVVNISVTQKASVRPTAGGPGRPQMPFGNPQMDDFFERFFGAPAAPPRSAPSRALGSGLIVDSSGYVVTNNHVIDGADTITVTLEDGTELAATLVGTDPKTDIALLKVASDEPLASVMLGDSDASRVGDWVLAIGNPFGLGGTATFGIISAIGRDIQSGPYDNYLQIDAPINSGNSGGPVFNTAGEVIGVNTAIFSPNGGNVGIGFAIPAAQVRKVTAELKNNGRVSRGWLGVQIQELDKELAASLGVAAGSGVLVADVVDDSPADKAALKVGDVITALNGQSVDSPKALSLAVAETQPNSKVKVTVRRDNKVRQLTVVLEEAEAPAALAANGEAERANPAAAKKLGLALAPLNDRLREQLGVDDDTNGLVVTAVDPQGAASTKGIRRGDVILSVDGEEMDTLSDFESAVARAGVPGRSVRMLVRRGDSQRFVALGLA